MGGGGGCFEPGLEDALSLMGITRAQMGYGFVFK